MTREGEFGDYIVYADESGDHNLSKINPDFPLFVLALCVFRKDDYISRVVPAMQRFKFRWFGHDMVVLHERDIRQHTGPFGFLENSARRARFMAELSSLIEAAPCTIVTSVIDKRSLTLRYDDPTNPYEIALRFCLERVDMMLRAADQGGQLVHCVFERRGAKEDADLELAFRRITAGANFDRRMMANLDIVFADKRANSTGMQIADLTARPIGLRHLRPAQPNRAFEIIESKLRRDGKGRYLGYGLKIFPDSRRARRSNLRAQRRSGRTPIHLRLSWPCLASLSSCAR